LSSKSATKRQLLAVSQLKTSECVLLQGTLHVPWMSIFKCVPLYALAVAHFTCNIGYYTLLTTLPLYFKHILAFDIKSVSLSVYF